MVKAATARRSTTGYRSPDWIIDRHIPLAMIITIILQTAGIVWYAAKFDARMYQVEQASSNVQPTMDRVTRIEARLDYIVKGLDDIKVILTPKNLSR